MKRASLVLSLVLAAAFGAQQSAPEDPYTAWQRGLDALKGGGASLAASELSVAARTLEKQNGVEPNRVVAFPLSAELDRVTGCRELERGNPHFDIPTTGAVAGDGFYYMANRQLAALGPGDVIREPERRKPVAILWMELP